MDRQKAAKNILERIMEGAKKEYGYGREDHRSAMRRALEDAGKEGEATRIDQMLGTNRTISMLKEVAPKVFGQANPDLVRARQKMGMGLSDDRATRIGQVLGTIGSDIVQDRGRELWWLINAPQAAASVIQDVAIKKFAPELFKARPVLDQKGNVVKSKRQAYLMGIADLEGRPKVGYSRTGKGYQERSQDPGQIDSLNIPHGIAINTAIGLMNPFGGAEGYKAVFEDPDDPSKTSNVIGEVAAKYVLGRTGGLLPWEEFKKVRPDVSKDEYMRYKAFRFDNKEDYNPLDGDFSVLAGVLKGTTEGIHGPEIQFLGRSLPVTTAMLPTAAAIAGTTIGARGGRPGRGLKYGLASTAAGMLAGNIIEGERRRRNKNENETDMIEEYGMPL